MSNFSSNPIIATNYLEFHTEAFPVEIFSNPDEQFGILSITVSKTKKTEKPLYIQCTIDNSDSMSDKTNKHSRLDYVKRTIIKMFEFLVENVETAVWIHVDTFSTNFSTIIGRVLLTKENVEDSIQKVMSLKTLDMTNIELALNSSDKIMTSMIQSNPEFNVVHLFLTDGEPTAGSMSVDTLVKLVNPKYTNVFIGYGAQHNSALLSKCANKTLQNKYLFVDNFENTGVVYGEIIHTLLYSAVKDVSITMSQDAFIYDAVKNQWVQTLMVPVLLSEKEHVYHVKSSSPETVIATLEGTIQNQLDNDGVSVDITGENEMLCNTYTLPNLVNPVNLSKYIFRQRTMELLYQASKIDKNHESIVKIKKDLKDFFKQMRLYMEANDLSEDTFMKILCEDIHLSYLTIGTDEGCMLSESRNTSHCQQTLYRSGSDSCRRPLSNNIRRQNAVCNDIQRSYSIQHYDNQQGDECEDHEDVEEDEQYNIVKSDDPNDIENYNTAFIREDIYSTQETIEITRAISG
jgi:von Willebrand factor type A domain